MPQYWANAIAGTLAGGIATTTLHPFDLIKTRLQVQDGSADFLKKSGREVVYKGTWDAFKKIVGKEGMKGLYQGLTPNLIGASSAWGLYFWSYNLSKSWIAKRELEKNKQSLESNFDKNLQNQLKKDETKIESGNLSLRPGQNLLAGFQAGLFTALVTNPIWVIKTRMQLDVKPSSSSTASKPHYRGVVHAFTTIWKEEGIRGLYRGLVPGLFSVSHGALQFMAYEELKKFFIRVQGNDESKLNSLHWTFMGATSKAFAVLATYPFQVVRSRLQQRPVEGVPPQYKGFIDAVVMIFKNEGAFGFYKGIVPNLIRVLPSASITFLAYENIIKLIPH